MLNRRQFLKAAVAPAALGLIGAGYAAGPRRRPAARNPPVFLTPGDGVTDDAPRVRAVINAHPGRTVYFAAWDGHQ